MSDIRKIKSKLSSRKKIDLYLNVFDDCIITSIEFYEIYHYGDNNYHNSGNDFSVVSLISSLKNVQ